jgi:hypothetical protein
MILAPCFGYQVVDELAHRLNAFGDALAVDVDAPFQLFGRGTDTEGEQADAHLADQTVAIGAAGGAPDRRMRLLQGLRQDPAPRH